MSTATAAPSAPSSSAPVDPIDSLDLSDVASAADTGHVTIPEHMMLGGPEKPKAEDAPVAEVAKPETATEPTLPEGWKKDSLGRVHRPDGKIASKEEVASFATTPTTPTPQVPQTPAPTDKPEPFQYRAFGETKNVEGFDQNADGSVTVKPEKVSELRYLLNARDALGQDSEFVNTVKAENAALKQEVEQYKKGTSAEVQQAKAITDGLTRIIQEPNEETALVEFFKLRENFPVLLANAKADYYEKLARSGKPADSSQAAPDQRETAQATQAPSGLPPREDAVATTTEHIERIKLDFKFRDLKPEDWKQFSERSARTPYAYVRPATADEVKQYGVRLGQPVVDIDALAADIEQYATSVRSARETVEQQTKLAADNARRTTPSVNAPPTPAGGPAPAKAPSTIKSKEDWEQYMASDEV